MHNVDSDVHTTEPEEWISEAGGGESVEVATECAVSSSDDGVGSAPIPAIVPLGVTGSAAAAKG
jgi:hypothetical protein